MGGGTKDKLLLQMTAESCNVKVYGGPIEATALGNVAVQLISAGVIKDIKEARKIIAEGENLTCYTPTENEKWEEAYKKFKEIILK
jgi:rhamnulokinase/L-fuculokinase